DVPGHRDTRGLNLPVSHVRVFQRLDAELTEGHPGAAAGRTSAAGPVLLAVRGPARDEHPSALLARGRGRLGHGAGTVFWARHPAGATRPARPGIPAAARGRAVTVTALASPQGSLQRLPLGLAGRDVAAVD